MRSSLLYITNSIFPGDKSSKDSSWTAEERSKLGHSDERALYEEQLHEKEPIVHDLERKLEDQDRDLHAIKLDNEAAWAKEGLLREQNKELETFRRERDHSEAERAQHLQQLHDLQEHLQEKERQLIELQEQHRLAQEAILCKDEQLNEA